VAQGSVGSLAISQEIDRQLAKYGRIKPY